MNPVEIREALNEHVGAFRRSYGETAKATARIILRTLQSYPWTLDQVPWDVVDECRRITQ